HHLAERSLELRALDQARHDGEATLHRLKDGLVRGRELARFRNGAELPSGDRERTVDEVAPCGEQLVVVPADELLPGEVGVLVLGAGGDEVVAQWIRVVPREEVADVDADSAARRELL